GVELPQFLSRVGALAVVAVRLEGLEQLRHALGGIDLLPPAEDARGGGRGGGEQQRTDHKVTAPAHGGPLLSGVRLQARAPTARGATGLLPVLHRQGAGLPTAGFAGKRAPSRPDARAARTTFATAMHALYGLLILTGAWPLWRAWR